MHRILLPLAALTLLYALWNVSTDSRSISFGWGVDWGFFLLQVLYWPAAIVAWICAIASSVFLFQKVRRIPAVVTLVLALPMVAYSLYHPRFSTMKKWHHQEELKERWFQSPQIVNHLLMKYLRDHPGEIIWPGDDEQIDPHGFITDLQNSPPLFYYAYGRKFSLKVSDRGVLTPWGTPILLGIDRNGDGYLTFAGQRGSLKAGHANPWADGGFYYKTGAGCLPVTVPPAIFDPGANYMGTLNDNDFQRLFDFREHELGRR